METHDKLSKVGEKWSTKLLLILGAILLVASLLMKIDYPYGFKIASLSSVEFTTLIIASAGLLFVGALFSLLQAWSWRRILRGQQELGIEILKKQVDIDKEVLTSKDRRRGGELIVLPTRIVKRHRH
jgi:membrane protein implicated in regulation of membrane protease activity